MTYTHVVCEGQPWPSTHEVADWEIFFEPIVEAVLSDQNTQGWVSVLLTHDDHMRELNKTYRGKDKPTNVLSFPMDKLDLAGQENACLGDVVLAYETIKKEAEEAGILFAPHAAHMMVHGTLHLLGYDHETDEEANVMETYECRIMECLGHKNPYQEQEC